MSPQVKNMRDGFADNHPRKGSLICQKKRGQENAKPDDDRQILSLCGDRTPFLHVPLIDIDP